MEEKPKRQISEEHIVQQLREGARRKRPWTLTRIMITIAIVAIPAVLIVWLTYPRPTPPDLHVIAFDQLALPGEKITLSAQLAPKKPAKNRPDLTGRQIEFEQGSGSLIDPNPKKETSKSDNHGRAHVAWTIPQQITPYPFLARYQPAHDKPPRHNRGQVFFYPADALLLLVNVESILPPDADIKWESASIHDVQLAENVPRFLRNAKDKKYQIVYLTTQSPTIWQYLNMRSWIQLQAAEQKLPSGPVLGRMKYDGASIRASALKGVLKSIRTKYRGTVVALVKNKRAPALYGELGIKTVTVADLLPK